MMGEDLPPVLRGREGDGRRDVGLHCELCTRPGLGGVTAMG